jgi:hypothetical protein
MKKHQLIGNPAVTAALVRPVEAGNIYFKGAIYIKNENFSFSLKLYKKKVSNAHHMAKNKHLKD